MANVRQAAELDQTRGRQNNAALKLLLRQHLENEEIIVASQLQDVGRINL